MTIRQKDYAVVRDNLREFFQVGEGAHVNRPRLNTGNTWTHECKKTEIAYRLQQEGHTFLMEGKLKTGLRPDITVLDVRPPIVYEVMASEKDDSIERKRALYKGLRIIKVKTEEALEDRLDGA